MSDRTLILNLLLDRFERSKHLRAAGAPGRAVFLRYDRATLPDYWDERNGMRRAELNAATESLAAQGLVGIRRSRYSHAEIERVDLNLARVDEAYREAGRTSRRDLERELERVALAWAARWQDHEDWRRRFADAVAAAAVDGSRLPAGLHHDEAGTLDELCRVLDKLGSSGLVAEVPRRVFSQRALGSSKRLEALQGKLVRCLREFWPSELPEEDGAALSEVGIVENPQFVYLAGPVVFGDLDLGSAGTALGLPTGFLQRCERVVTPAEQVITVENLTSFHQITAHLPPSTVAVYLGGYHNRVRRDLLARLGAAGVRRFLHWGDIDLGGFRIFVHLAHMTGLPFQPLLMDLETYRAYSHGGLEFSEAYAHELAALVGQPGFAVFEPVVREMLVRRRRVEQEGVEFHGAL